MGPALVGKDVVYKQVLTDPGMFSIIMAAAKRRDAVFPSPRHGSSTKCSGSSPM